MLARSQTPDLLLDAARRRPRRMRSRVRLPLLVPKGCTLPPPIPAYNNYLAPKPRRKAPPSEAAPGEAPRKVGAPRGNRNAAKPPRNPHLLAFQARVAELLARAEEAMARAELVIAARKAAPVWPDPQPPVAVTACPRGERIGFDTRRPRAGRDRPPPQHPA